MKGKRGKSQKKVNLNLNLLNFNKNLIKFFFKLFQISWFYKPHRLSLRKLDSRLSLDR